jgi:DNA-binding CsgD family transcriptional regulator
LAEAVLDRPDANDSAVVWATMSGAAAAGWLGRLDRALTISERGRAVAEAQADRHPWAQAQVGYGTCHALRAAGHLYRAQELAEQGHRAAVASDAVPMAGLWAGLCGIVAKAQGRLTDARAALREAVALLEDNDEYQCVRPCLAELAGTAALAGDTAAARDWLHRAEERKRAANRLFDAWVELDRAWVEAATGAISSALRTAGRAAELAREREQPAFEAVALYDIARFGSASAVRDRLDALAGQLEGDITPVLAQAAAALASGSVSSLERAAAAFTKHGHLLLAAEVTAAAARAHHRMGQTMRMRAAMERAASLGVACQGARTPLLDFDGLGTVLSRREREVATLAVTLPSREVADRLGLSVHTVNNTLARAYAKLGVRNRGELAAIFGGYV